VQRGHDAAFVVTVSAKNGSAAGVSVTLNAAPSSQQPAFTSGCAQGGRPAACAIGTVSDTKTVTLDAQIPVAAGATSVSSVTLTATAGITTTAKWTAPAAGETVAVTAAATSPASSSSSSGTTTVGATTVPLGPLPSLNGAASSLIGSSSLIGAGNASGLFPAISPAATTSPSPSPGVRAAADRRNAEPDAYSSTLAPVLSAQVAGLVVLALALALTVTRLSVRKRSRAQKPGR